MKVYLAGPMRGLPHFNYPTFNAVADRLRKNGLYVFNPAESGVFEEHGIVEAMREDLQFILDEADSVYALPGWRNSPGATCEVRLAQAIGKPAWEFFDITGFLKTGLYSLKQITALSHTEAA